MLFEQSRPVGYTPTMFSFSSFVYAGVTIMEPLWFFHGAVVALSYLSLGSFMSL